MANKSYYAPELIQEYLSPASRGLTSLHDSNRFVVKIQDTKKKKIQFEINDETRVSDLTRAALKQFKLDDFDGKLFYDGAPLADHLRLIKDIYIKRGDVLTLFHRTKGAEA